jgi:hypothetical protein
MADQVVCITEGCNHLFGDYPAGMETEVRQPCAECGGLSRKVLKSFTANVTPQGSLEYGAFPPGPKSKNRRFAWGMTGWDFSHRLCKLVRKESHFDERGDRRYEHVEDPDTGEVLHHEDHPLSEHRGHGSAKLKGGDRDQRHE